MTSEEKKMRRAYHVRTERGAERGQLSQGGSDLISAGRPAGEILLSRGEDKERERRAGGRTTSRPQQFPSSQVIPLRGQARFEAAASEEMTPASFLPSSFSPVVSSACSLLLIQTCTYLSPAELRPSSLARQPFVLKANDSERDDG